MKYYIFGNTTNGAIVTFKVGAKKSKNNCTKCIVIYDFNKKHDICAVNKRFCRSLTKIEVVKYRLLGYI